MGFLKNSIALALCCLSSWALAYQQDQVLSERDQAIQDQQKYLCTSTAEYKRALKFMRETKVIVVDEATSRKIADVVSRGCTDASSRFEKILILLKSVGVSDRKSLEVALEFSKNDPQVQRNFLEIFNRAFLSEFFDYDYMTAVRLAYELSKDYKGDAGNVRDDFIELARYCREGKELDLPTRLCAELAIKLAKLSQYYPEGIRKPFYNLFSGMRTKKEFQLDMKTALDVTYNVLKGGPSAENNFFEGYAYALSEKGLGLSKQEALRFAIKMAKRSYKGSEPPVIPPLSEEPKGTVTHASHTR